MLENCSKQSEFRAIAFALAFLHAAMLERKKFGVGNLLQSASGMNVRFASVHFVCSYYKLHRGRVAVHL
jgi:hypothetical protein